MDDQFLYIFPKREKWVELLKALDERISGHVTDLRWTNGDEQAVTATLLYRTMLEVSRAMRICVATKQSIAVPTLGRQVLDAFVDLLTVLNKKEHIDRMELTDALYWRDGLQQARRGNEYFKSFATDPNLSGWQKSHAEQIDEAARRGVTQANIKDRFKDIGMETIYHSVWKHLSVHSHNNISSLRNRHLTERTAGVVEFVSSENHTPFEAAAVIQTCDFLLASSEALHDRYGKGGNCSPTCAHDVSSCKRRSCQNYRVRRNSAGNQFSLTTATICRGFDTGLSAYKCALPTRFEPAY